MPGRKLLGTIENPTVEEAVEYVRKALSERRALVIVGNCWAEYLGRASSKLQSGERIVLIKEDGSVLVHRPTGYEPVNWQPPGCLFQASASGGVLEIRAVRRKPSESVKVFFDRIYLLSAFSLVDEGEFSLYASEEDMQRAILVEPEIVEAGFKPITYEKRVEPGFVDVYGIDRDGRLVVVEIKRRTAGRDAVFQLARYVDSIRSTVNREVRGLLVAPRLGKGVQRILVTLGLDFKAVDPRRCAEILSRSETKKLEEFFSENE